MTWSDWLNFALAWGAIIGGIAIAAVVGTVILEADETRMTRP